MYVYVCKCIYTCRCICMYVYMCVYVGVYMYVCCTHAFICMYMYMSIHVCMCICVHVFIYVCVCMHVVCMYVYMYVYICGCTCICMWVCICICVCLLHICIYMHVYVYIHTCVHVYMRTCVCIYVSACMLCVCVCVCVCVHVCVCDCSSPTCFKHTFSCGPLGLWALREALSLNVTCISGENSFKSLADWKQKFQGSVLFINCEFQFGLTNTRVSYKTMLGITPLNHGTISWAARSREGPGSADSVPTFISHWPLFTQNFLSRAWKSEVTRWTSDWEVLASNPSPDSTPCLPLHTSSLAPADWVSNHATKLCSSPFISSLKCCKVLSIPFTYMLSFSSFL